MMNILKFTGVTCIFDRGSILKSNALMLNVRGFCSKSNKDSGNMVMDSVKSNNFITSNHVNDIEDVITNKQSNKIINNDILNKNLISDSLVNNELDSTIINSRRVGDKNIILYDADDDNLNDNVLYKLFKDINEEDINSLSVASGYKIAKVKYKGNKIRTNKSIKIDPEVLKKLAIIKGGYKTYIKNSCELGNLMELLDKNVLIDRLQNNFIFELVSYKVYSILVNVSYVADGVVNGISPMKSMIVTGKSNTNLIAANILNGLHKVLNEYSIESSEAIVIVHWREWISSDEYVKLVDPVKRNEIIDEVLRDESQLKLDEESKLGYIKKKMYIDNIENYVSEFPNFNSITTLDIYKGNDNFNKFIKNRLGVEAGNRDDGQDKFTITVYKNNKVTSSQSQDNLLYYVFELESGKKRIICVGDTETWNTSLLYWNSSKYPYPKWTDELKNENEFIRTIGDYKYHIRDGKVLYWERLYNFQDMIMPYNDKIKDTRIGTLDLETYGDSSLGGGLGNLNVYAGGCALNTGYKSLYYIDKDKDIHSGDDIIKLMFADLFDYIAVDKKIRNGYTLYAHNFGRFDSVFILKSLAKAGYDIKAKWKDNDILSVKVRDKERKLSIKIMDSIKVLPYSLDKLLKSYDCNIHKGMFPHKFIDKDKIFYIGAKPDIKYYVENPEVNESKVISYNNLPDILNVKDQCLDYLEKDILGLLEVMNKVNSHYFNTYKLNITKFTTLPSLSLAMYGYWYKDNNISIKMIKGPLEKFIRNAYFGGNSNIFVEGLDRFVNEGYHYDMNSQYPNAMMYSMPTGNPVFSNNTELSYYNLGFVFAKITPPSKDVLSNLFIQKRNEDGSVSCPRKPFYEYISTVDLRQGLDYGYKAEILCGVNFPEACDDGALFGNFVTSLYEIKSTTTDIITKNIAKLNLNSTYGKFGQKECDYTIKMIHKDQVEDVVKKYHYSYITEISEDISLIKTGPKLNEKLRLLYADSAKFNYNDDLDYKFSKTRGIPSAVQISAMISSYARTSINPYKNISGNLAIASNTDSLILSKPLSEDLIGKELGKWKLEHKFKDGVFVRPKLYCYKDIYTNELIRKASGVNSSNLTYSDYVNLCNGKDVVTNKTVFKLNWSKLNIEIVNVETKLKGIKD